MPRLYTKEAAIAAGVEQSHGDDLINALNELFDIVESTGDVTFQEILDRLDAVETAAGI